MSASGNPCCWFEIPVTDMSRAKAFYEEVFGMPIDIQEMGPLKMGWFPMRDNEYGAMGSLVLGEGYTPSHAGSMVYFTVADIPATLAVVPSAGGSVLLPKTSIGPFGFIGILQDSEGNRIGIHSNS